MTTDADESFDDIHRLIDRAHRETAEADDVPASLWTRVRAETRTNIVEETPVMSMSSAIASPVFVGSQPQPGILQRFSGMVATLAIVAVLAFGGWFAAMNLPPANNGQQSALLQATPGTEMSCDVEPMTVDQVMAIVHNPMPYMYVGPTAPADVVAKEAELMRQTGKDKRVVLPQVLDSSGSVMLTEDQFDAASEVTNAYLGCLLTGTQAQVWTFYHPASIQSTIMAQSPVFATEEEVRAYVEERLDQPALLGENNWATLPISDDIVSATINPDSRLAIARSSHLYQIDTVLYVGVVLQTEENGVVVHTNGNGTNLVPNNSSQTGYADISLRITLVESAFRDVWMVVPLPSLEEVIAF